MTAARPRTGLKRPWTTEIHPENPAHGGDQTTTDAVRTSRSRLFRGVQLSQRVPRVDPGYPIGQPGAAIPKLHQGSCPIMLRSLGDMLHDETVSTIFVDSPINAVHAQHGQKVWPVRRDLLENAQISYLTAMDYVDEFAWFRWQT